MSAPATFLDGRPLLCSFHDRCPIRNHCVRSPSVSGVKDGDVWGKWRVRGDDLAVLGVLAGARRLFPAGGHGFSWIMRSETYHGFLGLGET